MEDPLTWVDRNKAEIAAYEMARQQRERMREFLAVILTIAGIAILVTLFMSN